MGGRGSSGGGFKGSADGTIMPGTARTIETIYRESRGMSPAYYKDQVLEATTDGEGNLIFSYAKADSFEKTAKTNRTNYVTYTLQAGAVNGETFGINWSKVNSISGQTYSLRKAAKDAGLKWDGTKKRWVRK